MVLGHQFKLLWVCAPSLCFTLTCFILWKGVPSLCELSYKHKGISNIHFSWYILLQRKSFWGVSISLFSASCSVRLPQLCISACCFSLQFNAVETVSFLKLHEPASVSFRLFFHELPHLFQTLRNWTELGPPTELGFSLLEYCDWFDLLSRPLKLSPRQQ